MGRALVKEIESIANGRLTKVEAFDAGAVLLHAVDTFDDGTEMKYDAILVPDDSDIEVVRDRAKLDE